MSQRLFLIRHCQAEGQEKGASLTKKGQQDAAKLAEFLKEQKVETIYSSPFVRTVQTSKPLSEVLGLSIQTDERLQERVLSTRHLPDWYQCLEMSFDDLTVRYHGGESSQEAMNRGIAAVRDILALKVKSAAIVTHGNLLALILHYFDKSFGFDAWKALTNPDVFLLTYEKNHVGIQRLWI